MDPESYGEKVVASHPVDDQQLAQIEKVRELYAEIINLMDDLRAERSERARIASVAITEAQTAQMWAVKAISQKE